MSKVLCERTLDNCYGEHEDLARRIYALVGDLKPATQYNYLLTLKKWRKYCQDHGLNLEKFDLASVMDFLKQYKATTRSGVAFRLRRIFQWNGESADFKVRYVRNELPEVLSEEEVLRLVDNVFGLKWKTIIRLTFEAAMRQHEVLGLKVKHVKLDKLGAEVFVPSTKTVSLWLRVIDSVPLLESWLNNHPAREDREAWLFPGKKVDENGKRKRLYKSSYWKMLREAARRAGIEKRVSPHILRHSRLAWLKKNGAGLGISDSVICKLYGRWNERNQFLMLARYGRVDPGEANQIILAAYDKLERREQKESLLKPIGCPRCRCENDASAKYCRLCGMILDEKEALEQMEVQKWKDDVWKVLRDPDKLDRFLKLLDAK